MNLAALVLALRPLLADVRANWGEVVALLDAHRSLAEYEVARHLVMRAVEPEVEAALASVDPAERRRAVAMLTLTYGRASASRALRALSKDPDPAVRGAVRRAVEALLLDDVALPDTRLARPDATRRERGGWNVSGWTYGVEPDAREPRSAPDAVIAARASLPRLTTRDDVAALLGVDLDALSRILRAGVGPGAPYVAFEIPKASGGSRTILAPRPRLKAAQRVILREILSKLPTHDAAHGFVPGRSTVSNAAPHQGAVLLVKTDLRDFFPAVHYRRVAGLFAQCGYGEEVASLLAALTTHRPRLANGRVVWPGALPQGAPTSPAIANLVCRRLDARLAGLAARVGATYTRYADDLTFSFRAEPSKGVGRFFWWVDQVCQQEGFVENVAKRRVLRPSNQQRVTGVVVNAGMTVPREARRAFRATLANCRRHGIDSQGRGREGFRAYLQGFAAYVKMVQPEHGAALVREVRELLRAERADATE